MQFTTEDEPDLTFPDGTVVRARLEEIKLRTFTWTDRKTNEEKESSTLEWWWAVTQSSEGPQYVGRKIKGECNPKLSNRADNRFRQWAAALLQREDIPVGMSIDTDDLVGLEAKIEISLRDDRKDKNKKWEYVSEVMSLEEDDMAFEPPF